MKTDELQDKVHLRVGPDLFTVGVRNGELHLLDHRSNAYIPVQTLGAMGVDADDFGTMLGEIWGDEDRNPEEIYAICTIVKHDTIESRVHAFALPVDGVKVRVHSRVLKARLADMQASISELETLWSNDCNKLQNCKDLYQSTLDLAKGRYARLSTVINPLPDAVVELSPVQFNDLMG